jgi:hypothetical protein
MMAQTHAATERTSCRLVPPSRNRAKNTHDRKANKHTRLSVITIEIFDLVTAKHKNSTPPPNKRGKGARLPKLATMRVAVRAARIASNSNIDPGDVPATKLHAADTA